MRIWQCDKCDKISKGLYKPDDFCNVKVFFKAQKKGGKAICFDLCIDCAKELFKTVKLEEAQKKDD